MTSNKDVQFMPSEAEKSMGSNHEGGETFELVKKQSVVKEYATDSSLPPTMPAKRNLPPLISKKKTVGFTQPEESVAFARTASPSSG